MPLKPVHGLLSPRLVLLQNLIGDDQYKDSSVMKLKLRNMSSHNSLFDYLND